MISLGVRVAESSATALSCRSSAQRARSGECRLARKSLSSLLIMLSLSGCIVADPPRYDEPRRTAPFMDLSHAQPSQFWVIVVDRTDMFKDEVIFKIPFRSDDQGDSVVFGIHLDYKSDDVYWQQGQPVPPSTLDSVAPRFLDLTWSAPGGASAGCHQLTLIAAHESSWDYTRSQPKADAPPDDISVATWWMNIIDQPPGSGLDPYSLPHCPNQAEVQP